MILTEKLEYLGKKDWYIGTDIAEKFADSYLQGNLRRWGQQSRVKLCRCTNMSKSYSRRLKTCSSFVSLYIFAFSSFYIFILLLLVSLHFFCLSSCVLFPLLEVCSAYCCRTCRPNPVVSDRDKEPELGVRCPLQICYSRVQDKRVHVVCRRLLMLVSHYLNNGRKRTLKYNKTCLYRNLNRQHFLRYSC